MTKLTEKQEASSRGPITEHQVAEVVEVVDVTDWRRSNGMPVPYRDGHTLDVLIVNLYETTTCNGQPLDLLVEVMAAVGQPVKRFGVIFSDSLPDWTGVSAPLRCSGGAPERMG